MKVQRVSFICRHRTAAARRRVYRSSEPWKRFERAPKPLAVSEVATERLAGASNGPVRLQFELQDDRLIVDLHADAAPAGSEDSLSRAIVEATVDEVPSNDSSVRLVKRLPDSEPEA